MQLRPIVVTLAGAVLASGLLSMTGVASTALASTGQASTARHSSRAAAAPMTPATKASLRAAASTGVVTGLVAGHGGAALTGACVVAVGRAGSQQAMTGVDGRYVLGGLRPGKYTLQFSDCSAPSRYFDQWYGGAGVPGQAKPIAVAAGQVKTLSKITLRSAASQPAATGQGTRAWFSTGTGPTRPMLAQLGARTAIASTSAAKAGTGAISGTVTGKGKPLAGICVRTFGRGLRTATTTSSGSYRIGKLQPGKYDVIFSDCGSTAKDNWLPQVYRNITGFFLPRHPTKVTVTAGKTTKGIDAALELGGQISGTVRSKAGTPVRRVCVDAFASFKHFGFGFGTVSAANGRYVLHSVMPGSYTVRFIPDCSRTANFVPQFWRDTASQAKATKVAIRSGTVATGIDASLLAGGAITGVVRGDTLTGPRLGGICIEATGRSKGALFTTAQTAKNGSYTLIGLTTGRYELRFFRCRNSGNYLNTTHTVHVTQGKTLRQVDVAMPPGAVVRGVVTDIHGNPVSGICVRVSGAGFGGTTSGPQGGYTINAQPTGNYRVEFSGGCGNTGSYAPQFYNGQTNVGSANLVALTAGQVTGGIGAVMQPGGTISGTVTNAAGKKLSRICVLASPVSGQRFGFFFFGSASFTNDGAYTVANLPPGLYSIAFNCGGSRPLAREWFRSRPTSQTSDLVSAPAGQITSGISAALPAAGAISGLVTNRSGTPLPDICVQVSAAGSMPPQNSFGPVGFSITRRDGTYSVPALAPGHYQIEFSDCGRRQYASQWYHGKLTEKSATPVPVTAGLTTAGANVALKPGGTISGRVTDMSGAPITRNCVVAQDQADGFSGVGAIDKSGRYTITALAAGSYQVTFGDCGQKFGAASDPNMVQVTDPGAVTGVNAKLGPSGSIAGTVLGGPAATPQDDVCVVAIPAGPGGASTEALTDIHGTYRLPGLAAGKYQVYFGDQFCPTPFSAVGYAPLWYDQQQDQAHATDVTVTAGAQTGGIGATLRQDGAITGTVVAGSHGHAPVAGECVTTFPVNQAPDPLFGATFNPAIAVSASDGSYAIVGLQPGQYKVEFTTGCGDSGYQTQWWRNAGSAATARLITVSANGTVTGINAALQP